MALDLFADDGIKRFQELLSSRMQADSRHVFLLHGIKTRGKWQKDVSPLLASNGLIPIPLDFGNFGARQLLWWPARKKKLKWLLDEFQTQCARLGCKSPSIVAHSFGCYLVASLLSKYPQVRFDRIIFCGSIVRPTYPWADVAARGQVKAVLNQYGREDFWAWVVQWLVKDAGPSGYSGFAQPVATVQQQNKPEFEHSDYFYDLNYKENWIPFLLGKQPATESKGPYAKPASINLRFGFVLAVGLLMCSVAAVALGWYSWSWLEERPSSEPRALASHIAAPQRFSGFVQDDSGNPLPGVTLTAPTLNVPPQTTDSSGRFSFQVELPAGTNFRLIAQKSGFETYTADPPSGDTTFNISLHREPGKRSR